MRKILSLILTAVLVITSVSAVCIATLAEDVNYTVYETVSIADDTSVTLGSANLLTGTAYYINSSGVGAELATSSNYQGTAWLTNGSYASNHLINLRFDNAIGGGIVYGLGSFYAANQFVLCTSETNPITSFEVYVGNDRDSIFAADNLVAAHTRKDDTALHYVITMEDGAAVSGKYMGIKVVDTRDSATTKSAWFVKISAYGTNGTTFENLYDGAYSYPQDVSLNFGQLPLELIKKNGTVISNPVNGATYQNAEQSLLNLTDGDFANDLRISQIDANHGGELGLKVTYDLKNDFEITNVLLATGQDNLGPFSTKWKLYISDSKDDLYNAANCCAYVEDTTITAYGGKQKKLHNVKLHNVKGRYVGIENLGNAISGWNPFYASEVAIYGTDTWTVENDFNFTVVPQNNLLSNINTFYWRGAEQATNVSNSADLSLTGGHYTVVKDNFSNYSAFFDNTFAKEASISNGHNDKYSTTSGYGVRYRNAKMVFDLGEGNAQTIGAVYIDSYTYKYKYRAYVGNDPATLFSNENLLAISDDMVTGDTYAKIDAAHQKTGRYMGIMITGGTNATFKATEIAFYAADKATTSVATDVTSEPINAGKELYVGANSTVGTSVQEKDGNNQPVSKLTNNYLLDQSNVKGQGGYGLYFWNGGHNMTYDLGAAADVSKILISGGKKSSGNNTMAIKCYGVYMSNDKATLYSAENQVAFVLNDDYTQAHVFDTSSVEGTYRYVGFRIFAKYPHYPTETATSPVTNIYLTEFGIYGNFPTDDYTVIANPTEADIAGLGSNGLAGATLDDTDIDNVVITDGEIYTDKAVNITATSSQSVKLTYKLACSQNINAVLVGGAYATETVFAPGHYKVYASNSAEKLFDSPVIDYYVADLDTTVGSNGGMVKLFKFATSIEAEYIGIEFMTGFDTRTMSVAEIAVYSTVALDLDTSAQITDAADVESIWVDGVESGSSLELGSDIMNGNRTIVIYGNNGNSDVYFTADGTVVYKSALKNAVSIGSLPELRTDEPVALRFVTEVTLDAKASATEMGTIVAKWQDLNGAALVRGATDYKIADAIAYEKDAKDIKCGDDTATLSHFSVALHNITQKKYLNNYIARPYITVSEGDKVYTVYGKSVMCTPLDVAENIKSDANASAAATAWADEVIANSDIVAVNNAYATSYNITADMLSNAVVTETPDNDNYTPNLARLKKLIEKAKRGEDLVIGTIGGSITRGAYADPIDINCYANLVREWFANTFGVNVKLINIGVSSTHSNLGVYRVQQEILDKDPDLVILEYAVNENTDSVTYTNFGTYEAIVRKVLSHNDDVALLEMFMIKYKNNSDNTALEFINAQEMQSKIGGHYGVPMISFYDAVLPLLEEDQADFGAAEGDYWNLIMADGIHPNNYGHKIAATLITNYIAGVVADVDSITDTVSALPEVIEGSAAGAYTGTSTLYNSLTLPSEYVVSYGSYAPIHNANADHPNMGTTFIDCWYAENKSGEVMEPMIIRIPSGKTVSILLWREKDTKGVGAHAYIENSEGTIRKGLQNYNTSEYFDPVFCYTNETAQPLTITFEPLGDAAGEWSLIAGIMVTE